MPVKRKYDPPMPLLNSPFKWVGGKSRLRRYILPLLPQHTCYVEPFAGAAWVLFGKQPSDVEVLNDIDDELINFFRVLKESPEELIASFDWDIVARAEFERLASTEPDHLTPVQRAHRFYYIIMAGWGGELDYPRFQTSIKDGGHGNRLAGALKTLRGRLEPVHQRLRTVIIEHLDWRECVDRYDSETTFFYLDPPYPENGANYFHNMRSWDEHRTLAARLTTCNGRWLLSSYDTPAVRELYRDYRTIPIESASGMSTTKDGTERVLNREVLVANYIPPEMNRIELPNRQGKLTIAEA